MFTPTIYTLGQRYASRPFGVRMPNRVTLEKSVDNRKSVLGKTVTYLTRFGEATRKDIQVNALGLKAKNVRSFRGWNSNLFSAMIRSGFIQKNRKGRTVVYTLGNPADHILL
jgi:hypothetical protein